MSVYLGISMAVYKTKNKLEANKVLSAIRNGINVITDRNSLKAKSTIFRPDGFDCYFEDNFSYPDGEEGHQALVEAVKEQTGKELPITVAFTYLEQVPTESWGYDPD